MGGNALRSRALSDPDVIASIERGFIPVWLDVREQPIPDIPGLDEQVLANVRLTDTRRAQGWNEGFLVRSVVLSPDGTEILNPQENRARLEQLSEDGHFAYAQVEADDYLEMLNAALARHGES